MYLSRFDFDASRRTAARWAASPHSLHAAVMRSCSPDDGDRVLWRLDRHTAGAELYVVSSKEPDPHEIVAQATDAGPGAFATADYDSLLSRIAAGQRWNFRLTANPTYIVPAGHGRRGLVRPHVTATHQLDWFREKALASGFTVTDERGEDTARLVGRETRSFHGSRTKGGSGSPVTLTYATLEGALTVTDADLLRDALTNGIGRGKGYGCGLLTLARP